jgi:hypothetical protein
MEQYRLVIEGTPEKVSTVIAVVCDVVESLSNVEVLDDRTHRVAMTTGRNLLNLVPDLNKFGVKVKYHRVTTAKRKHHRERNNASEVVAEFLKSGTKSPDDVRHELTKRGFAQNTHYGALHNLKKAGKVEKDDNGNWRLRSPPKQD